MAGRPAGVGVSLLWPCDTMTAGAGGKKIGGRNQPDGGPAREDKFSSVRAQYDAPKDD